MGFFKNLWYSPDSFQVNEAYETLSNFHIKVHNSCWAKSFSNHNNFHDYVLLCFHGDTRFFSQARESVMDDFSDRADIASFIYRLSYPFEVALFMLPFYKKAPHQKVQLVKNNLVEYLTSHSRMINDKVATYFSPFRTSNIRPMNSSDILIFSNHYDLLLSEMLKMTESEVVGCSVGETFLNLTQELVERNLGVKKKINNYEDLIKDTDRNVKWSESLSSSIKWCPRPD